MMKCPEEKFMYYPSRGTREGIVYKRNSDFGNNKNLINSNNLVSASKPVINTVTQYSTSNPINNNNVNKFKKPQIKTDNLINSNKEMKGGWSFVNNKHFFSNEVFSTEFNLEHDMDGMQSSNSTDCQKVDCNTGKKTQYRKTKLCPWHKKGDCFMGSSCNYAHSKNELRPKPDLSKTRLCPMILDGRSCFDAHCPFAHDFVELRATSTFFKTKLCKFWQKGVCPAGSDCRHAHGKDELRNMKKFLAESSIDLHKFNNMNLSSRETVCSNHSENSNITNNSLNVCNNFYSKSSSNAKFYFNDSTMSKMTTLDNFIPDCTAELRIRGVDNKTHPQEQQSLAGMDYKSTTNKDSIMNQLNTIYHHSLNLNHIEHVLSDLNKLDQDQIFKCSKSNTLDFCQFQAPEKTKERFISTTEYF